MTGFEVFMMFILPDMWLPAVIACVSAVVLKLAMEEGARRELEIDKSAVCLWIAVTFLLCVLSLVPNKEEMALCLGIQM